MEVSWEGGLYAGYAGHLVCSTRVVDIGMGIYFLSWTEHHLPLPQIPTSFTFDRTLS